MILEYRPPSNLACRYTVVLSLNVACAVLVFCAVEPATLSTFKWVLLGVSISSDVVRSHGGKIELGKSELGGLKIRVSLPF